MPVDLNDPKMAGFVPLNREWAEDCPSMASRRIRDESHSELDPDGAGTLAAFPNHVDDVAAKAGGVKLGGFYRTGSVVKIRTV